MSPQSFSFLRAPRNAIAIVLPLLFTSSVAMSLEPMQQEEGQAYEASFEVAHAAEILDQLSEDADTMLELDLAQQRIFQGACKVEYREYIQSVQEVAMLDQRAQQGEQLSVDERDWRSSQATAAKDQRQDLDQCFTREAAGIPALRKHGITTNEALSAAYERAVKSYRETFDDDTPNPTLDRLRATLPVRPNAETETKDLRRISTNWREERARMVEERNKVIGVFERVHGSVEIWSFDSNVRYASAGDGLIVGDTIATGLLGSARIAMSDQDPRDGSNTVFDIGSNSRLIIRSWAIKVEDATQRYGLIQLLRGVTRAFSKNWGSRSSFNIRTGIALCGIRGTDIAVRYRPELDESHYRLTEGTVVIQTDGGRSLTLRAGQSVTATRGVIGPVGPLNARPPA